MRVEIAYATPGRQRVCALEVTSGATVEAAIRASGVLEAFPEIDLGQQRVGIFGRPARLDQPLADGDRVEIYRPLAADPKESRRRRAAKTAT